MEKVIISKSVVQMNDQDLESVAGGFELHEVWVGMKNAAKPYVKSKGGVVWDRTLGKDFVLACLVALGYGLAKRNEIYNWLRSKFKSNKVETKK